MATDIRNLSIQFKTVKPATAEAPTANGKDGAKDDCISAAKGNGEPDGWRIDARRQWLAALDMLRER